jgi:hypothetical protein
VFLTKSLVVATMPSLDELQRATSSRCVPYMADDLSDEELRRYITSFAEDKTIPRDTLFNVFQTTLKLFNTAGGTSKLSVWNTTPDTAMEATAYNTVFNDAVCISYWFS